MKSRILFLLKYYCFWILIFILQKLMFMTFNFHESSQLTFIDWMRVIWNGLRLDLSAGAYLMVIPVLIMIFLSFLKIRYLIKGLLFYNYLFLLLVLFLGVVDMELYSYWGFKLDVTPLVYLKTPKEAAASLDYTEVGLLFLLFLILYYAGIKVYRRYILSSLNENEGSD